jgi:hypothetical protein
MTDPQSALVEVELRDFPLAVFARAEEHSDGLMREFTLIAGGESSDAVPRRLLALAERLEAQYGDYTAGYEREIEAARDRGDEFVTVRLHVPPAARAAAVELGEMLAEADEYCRRGDLLSLVPGPEVLRFRHWYIDQFVSQIDGRPPVPWPDYIDAVETAPRP